MLKNQFQYQDKPTIVNNEAVLLDKLTSLHEVITVTFGFVDRLAISVYSDDTGELRTFIASCHGENTLKPYCCQLSERPSLLKIVKKGRPSVIKNLNVFSGDAKEQRECGITMGFPESYAMPIYEQSRFYGFVFFNSKQNEVFDEQILFKMDLFAHMISLMVMHDLSVLNASQVGQAVKGRLYPSDPVTSAHRERMSCYAHLIMSKLIDKYTLDQGMIAAMCVYQPSQGGGKVGVSDSLLIKSGCLTQKEYNIMKSYTELGREMIDRLVDNFSFEGFDRVGILSNIAEYHYGELLDSGKQSGSLSLTGGVPTEAKIVAVADVFDMLNSQCDSSEGAGYAKCFDIMKNIVVNELDEDCVSALMASQEQIKEIQMRHK